MITPPCGAQSFVTGRGCEDVDDERGQSSTALGGRNVFVPNHRDLRAMGFQHGYQLIFGQRSSSSSQLVR